MVVLSIKFTILVSWSPICIPLILLSSALMRLAQDCITTWDSLHDWQTLRGGKGSERRLFILILDSILDMFS